MAGETIARLWRERVTIVDLYAPEKAATPPLILDEVQCRISRVVRALAEGARGDVPSRFGALALELLRQRVQAMIREGRRVEALDGLRSMFGEARAEEIAAAFMPDDPEERQRHDARVEAIAVERGRAHEEAMGATVHDVSWPDLARRQGFGDWPGFDLRSQQVREGRKRSGP